MSRRTMTIAALVIAVVAAIVIIANTGFVSQEQRHEEHLNLYGADLMATCAAYFSEQPIENTLSSQDEMKMLILEAGSERAHRWHDTQPEAFFPASRDEIDWIVCVERDWVTVATCTYNGTDGRGGTVDRITPVLTLTAVDPQSGDIIGQIQLVGGEPDECPQFLRAEEDFNDFNEIVGSFPDHETFVELVFN